MRGTFFGGPHNKDYSILGSILGFPYFGKLPFRVEDRIWGSQKLVFGGSGDPKTPQGLLFGDHTLEAYVGGMRCRRR